MPPSGFNPRAAALLVAFVSECYKDLQKEVESGKHPDMETAVRFEISQIEKSIRKIHISDSGDLVERPIPKDD